MNLKTALLLMALGSLVVLGAGCSDDDTPTDSGDPVSEFEGYEDWDQVEYTIANSDLLGPGAHQGGANDTYTRAIFMMDGTRDESEGTIYVKETYSWDADGNKEFAAAGGLLAMKKREVGYHDNGNDWEYFMLDASTLDVINSGHGESGIGGCMGCHNGANSGGNGEDFIFAHPSEYIAHVDSFAGFDSWTVIGTETGPDALLGPAHAGNDANATRTIYKRQIKARPDNNWGYPVGTMLVKVVTDDQEEVIGQTAMVKRGGGFDAANGDWEYFMWDVDSGELADQGAMGMCIGCHTAATGTNGTDFVFAHDGDPFNN